MTKSPKIGGGRFSALEPGSPSNVSRMLTETEQQSLRDFAKQTIEALRQKRAAEKVRVSELEVFDAADHLNGEEDVAAYLKSVGEEGDPALLAAALDDVARAARVIPVEKELGVDSDSE